MFKELINVLGYDNLFLITSIIVFIYGLVIGSFLNVVIFRFETKESIAHGRSHCMKCGKQIKWYDNIPVLSYLILGGRCRYCKEKISIIYPVVELLNAILCTLVFIKFGFAFKTIIYMIMVSSLIALSFIDERTFLIHNSNLLLLFLLGIINMVYEIFNGGNYLELILGGVICGLYLLLFFGLTKGRGLGFGDVLLMSSLGLILGLKNASIGFILGCILAIVIHLIRMKVSNKTSKLSFGPYISMGAYLGLFFGETIINAYLTFLEGLLW